ncbi:MAG TPA: hypothetical protein VK778_01840 [Solirubrobacteraceae bacterium]|nr:hypothetical protein [Solirubrobacteraceae bacterium]
MSARRRHETHPAERRTRVLVDCAERVNANKRPGWPLLVAITGPDAVGKSRFTEQLEPLVRKPVVVHLDDFHNPRSVRYGGTSDDATRYYHRSFDLTRLVECLLEPVRAAGHLTATLDLIDLPSDSRTVTRDYEVETESTLLVEGVFLMRPELVSYWDFSIVLTAPERTTLARAAARDKALWGGAVEQRYERKYIPAQRRYEQECDPMGNADLVIDNSRWQEPVICDA